MERMTHFRPRALLLLFVVLLGFFIFQLYDKQVIETGGAVDNSTTFTTLTRVKAARGDILDCHGNVLVGNRASYDVVINHYVLVSSDNPNENIHRLLRLCKELGIEYTERFPVTREKPFTYTLDQQNSAWQGYFQQFLAERGDIDTDISAPLLIEKLRSSYKIPEDWTDEEARQVLGIRYEMTLRNLTTLPNYVFLSDASDEARAAILELNIPGVGVEASTVREYHTKYAAHVLGYVGAMNEKQWEEYKKKGGYSMDAEVGQAGFELAFEEELHGTDGWRVDEVRPDGTLVRSYYKDGKPPRAGNNVEVTIDIDMQGMAEEQLATRIEQLKNEPDEKVDGHDVQGAAVVVMDVKTGRVLVCASYPTYDPATFFEDYEELAADKLKPLYNRALMAAYPPGSTYKMCMVVAASNLGIINSGTTIADKGEFNKYIDSGGFNPKCLLFRSSGNFHKGASPDGLTAAEALKFSCNYFFYVLADWMDIEDIDETTKNFGLGEYTGVELPENKGWRSNPETKAHFQVGQDAGWYTADRILTGIGQAECRFTPIQLCVYATTLANRGQRYEATFLNRVVSTDYRSLVRDNQPTLAGTFEINDEAYYSYFTGMQMVASEYGGTGYKIFKDYPIKVACKTGTAQTGILNTSDNGSFLCFAPADDPEIAIAVYGERAGSGSAMGYVARNIMDVYFGIGEVGEVEVYENQIS